MIQFIYERHVELSRYADAKLGSLAAIAIVVAAIITSNSEQSTLEFMSLVVICFSLATMILGIFPNTDKFGRRDHNDWSTNQQKEPITVASSVNPLYYHDAANCTEEALLDRIRQYNEPPLDENTLRDFARQIQAHARISEYKFRSFKISSVIFLIALGFLIMSAVPTLTWMVNDA